MPNTRFKKRLNAARKNEYSKLKRFRIGLCIAFGFEVVLIFAAWLVGYNTELLRKNCTRSVNAVVTRVDEKKKWVRILSLNHGGRYKYVTVITTSISVQTDCVFKESTITTHDGHYKKDQKLKIYYDPKDPSNYYIEDRLDINNKTQIVIIVIAVLWAGVFLLLTWVTYKQHKKCRSGKLLEE